MRKWSLKMVAAGLIMTTVVSAGAAPRSIGTAMARGEFRLDGANVSGNAMVLEGSALEVTDVASTVRLNQGGAITLGNKAKVTFNGDRMILERGIGQVSGTTGYPIEARKMLVQPAEGSQARVMMEGSDRILVAATRGPVRVSTVDGIILANIASGATMAFTPQAGAIGSTTVRGTLTKSGDSYLLKDRTTNVVFQVTGCDNFARMVNKNVSVTGVVKSNVPVVVGASQVIEVGCSNIVAAGAAGSGGIGAAHPASMGVLAGHSTALVTGIAVAAAGVGIGLGVQLSQDGTPTSR